jgi:hypothetical protein
MHRLLAIRYGIHNTVRLESSPDDPPAGSLCNSSGVRRQGRAVREIIQRYAADEGVNIQIFRTTRYITIEYPLQSHLTKNLRWVIKSLLSAGALLMVFWSLRIGSRTF